MKKEIIVIAGPTAVGKTKYAIEIAAEFCGEIVSADSMQLYKYMNIGSAKPMPAEMAKIKHHLVDEIDPRIPFSVAEYQKKAKVAIEDIFVRGKQPVISGGTGLYINSLIYQMDFTAPPVSLEYRKHLESLAEREGGEGLHTRLQKIDPDAAARIHPNNIKKLIRALEVAEHSDKRIPSFDGAFIPTADYTSLLIGLTRNREELYSRIDQRVDLLIEEGLVEEVKGLLAMGLSVSDISMKGIGYKEIIGYLMGEYGHERAVALVKQNTRNYAKRQLTWFKRLPNMKWFNLSEYRRDEEALEEMYQWLYKKK